MKIMAAGDWHGNLNWAKSILYKAKANDVDKIIQCGDFGFIWSETDYSSLYSLNEYAAELDLPIIFLPGNHENHWLLNDLSSQLKQNAEGFTPICSHIFYAGRVNQWTWNDKIFTVVGGAVSIDKDWRIQHFKRTGERIWWPEEELKEEEFVEAGRLPETDYLFSHDAPSCLPMADLKPDIQSQINRTMMSEVGKSLRPKYWIHGHYHHFMNYKFYAGKKATQVYGLNCDDSSRKEHTLIIEA